MLLDARAMLAAGGAGLPDGMKVARDGTLVCSVPGGMMLMTPETEPLGLIEQGAPIANCAFGETGRALFLAAKRPHPADRPAPRLAGLMLMRIAIQAECHTFLRWKERGTIQRMVRGVAGGVVGLEQDDMR